MARYSNDQQVKFIFLGMPVLFSIRILEGLIKAGRKPSAVLIPDGECASDAGIRQLQPEPLISDLPLLRPYFKEGIAPLAWEHGIELYALSDIAAADTVNWLNSLDVDVGIVACFPRKLPEELLNLPRFGFLNLHPSLLPAYRGPYPMFWSFRDGMQRAGITLHQVDSGLDTGDIVIQEETILPDGIGSREVDESLAAVGAAMIVEALARLLEGPLPHREQGDGGNYFGRPKKEDFAIATDWSARRAFNFMRGTADWETPYRITGNGIDLLVRKALAFAPADKLDTLPALEPDETRITFSDGVLHVSNW